MHTNFKKFLIENHSKKNELRRAEIILKASEVVNFSEVARCCKCDRGTVSRWYYRALEFNETFEERLEFIKKETGHSGESTRVTRLVQSFLADKYRSGAPATYTALQYTKIIEIALIHPKECGYLFLNGH